MIEMGERYGREMMLFVYVPERNIYFVSTEEGTTYAYQRALADLSKYTAADNMVLNPFRSSAEALLKLMQIYPPRTDRSSLSY